MRATPVNINLMGCFESLFDDVVLNDDVGDELLIKQLLKYFPNEQFVIGAFHRSPIRGVVVRLSRAAIKTAIVHLRMIRSATSLVDTGVS
jgi:hypothetical protein